MLSSVCPSCSFILQGLVGYLPTWSAAPAATWRQGITSFLLFFFHGMISGEKLRIISQFSFWSISVTFFEVLCFRFQQPNLESRPRSHSTNSYYTTERGNVIHQGTARVNEEKIIMTPVTPDQSIRGLEPTWSVVPAPPLRQQPHMRNAIEVSKERPHVAGPILICIFLMLSYISCSAAIMMKIQSWTFFDSFYFCFMSIFTVGFGGLEMRQSNLMACVIYIFIGLILVSTCGHIFYQEVLVKYNSYNLAREPIKPRQSQEYLSERKTKKSLSWRESELCLATIRPHRTHRDSNNTFKPIIPSVSIKRQNARLRFGQPIILSDPSNWSEDIPPSNSKWIKQPIISNLFFIDS